MKKLFSLVLVSIMTLTLIGCGLKGDLYLPKDESSQNSQPKGQR